MEVEDRQFADFACCGRQRQGGVKAAPFFAAVHGQIDIALVADRKPTQGCIAVMTLFYLDIEPQRVIGIVQGLGQFLGQIKPLGAGDPDIHLLEEDNVGPVVLQYRDDPFRSKTAINADGAVDVVGKDLEPA